MQENRKSAEAVGGYELKITRVFECAAGTGLAGVD